MDLHELAAAIRRRWKAVVTFTVLGALAAFAFTLNEQPVYRATATVLISPASGQTAGDLNNSAAFLERVVRTYAQLADTTVVLGPVSQEFDMSAKDLGSAVDVTFTSGTMLVGINVNLGSPSKAADVANAIGDELAVAVYELAPRNASESSVVVTSVAPAVAPTNPVSPSMPANVLLGAVVGLLIGLGYVTVREAVSSRKRSRAGA